jgi:glycogen(starch) synthase
MKILYWIPFFLPDTGGIETLSAKLLPEFAHRGHQLIVVTSHGAHPLPDLTFHEGIPVHRFHFRNALRKDNFLLIPQILSKIVSLKEEFQPDLVHIHVSDPSGFFHLKTHRAHPVPTILTLHNACSIIGNLGPNTMMSELLERANWITAVSKNTLSGWVEVYPQLSDKSSVVYNGVEIPQLDPLPLPFYPPSLLCLGRLIPQKRIDLAIRAMVVLRQRFPLLQLTIAGEGHLRKELEELAASYGLCNCVRFTGGTPPQHVPNLLNANTLLVMPSDWEGFPLAALEAASMARPIVATNVGGNPEIILHRQTGLVVPPQDAEALAEAITYLLDRPQLAEEMGLAGRKRIREEFNLQRTASAYEEIYHRLINEHD